jgi:hypothetical protein
MMLTNSGRQTEDASMKTSRFSGDLNGVGVPLELVRGFGQIMVIFGRTWFGA